MKWKPIDQLATMNDVVVEAWKLRQIVERRLTQLAIEQARFERVRDRLDAQFGGEMFFVPIQEE